MGRWNKTLLLLLPALAAGCSAIIDAQLADKVGEDAGPTGETCSTDDQCVAFDMFNCHRGCAINGHCDTTLGAEDGTHCGPVGARMHCVDEECVAMGCGDGFVDRSAMEYCDDGNMVDSDGCNNDCTRSCVPPAPPNCDDGNLCNGMEVCGMVMGVCRVGPPAADGTACDVGGTPGTCETGDCIPE